mmetsp:Transcript_35213/g.76406  ORF Transcript_35213/g.76406 Transcript_35213/m.76406 type:complete len:211 (-) Transcript_35213:439-1071(-)
MRRINRVICLCGVTYHTIRSSPEPVGGVHNIRCPDSSLLSYTGPDLLPLRRFARARLLCPLASCAILLTKNERYSSSHFLSHLTVLLDSWIQVETLASSSMAPRSSSEVISSTWADPEERASLSPSSPSLTVKTSKCSSTTFKALLTASLKASSTSILSPSACLMSNSFSRICDQVHGSVFPSDLIATLLERAQIARKRCASPSRTRRTR